MCQLLGDQGGATGKRLLFGLMVAEGDWVEGGWQPGKVPLHACTHMKGTSWACISLVRHVGASRCLYCAQVCMHLQAADGLARCRGTEGAEAQGAPAGMHTHGGWYLMGSPLSKPVSAFCRTSLCPGVPVWAAEGSTRSGRTEGAAGQGAPAHAHPVHLRQQITSTCHVTSPFVLNIDTIPIFSLSCLGHDQICRFRAANRCNGPL